MDRAQSRLAQENAKLKNARSSYSSRKQRLEKKAATVASCKIKAPAPGLVVYAINERYGRREGPIEPGLVIRERQELMTLAGHCGNGRPGSTFMNHLLQKSDRDKKPILSSMHFRIKLSQAGIECISAS